MAVLSVLCAGMCSAAILDAASRRIPNVVCAATAASGVVLAATGVSRISLASSLIGLTLGMALMLPGYIFRSTGAGDVKLFAAIGAVIGPTHIAVAFVYTAIAGGVLALIVAVQRRRLRQTIGGTAHLIVSARAAAAAIESPLEHNRFAFAPAIAVGATLAALGL